VAVALPLRAVLLFRVVVFPRVAALPVVLAIPLPDAVAVPVVFVTEPVTKNALLSAESSTRPIFQSRSFVAPKAAKMQLKKSALMSADIFIWGEPFE
jgi:hypothetical protein